MVKTKKLIKEIPELSGKQADKFAKKMLDVERYEERVGSLDRNEVYDYGELVLGRIIDRYNGLIFDADMGWDLQGDLKKLDKIITLVIRLQQNRILKETNDTNKI